MRSPAATPFIVRSRCIQHFSCFVAAIRPRDLRKIGGGPTGWGVSQSDEHLLNVTAHHEAAHGVILYRVVETAGHVSIVPNQAERTLGRSDDPGVIDSGSADDLRGHILSLYAGGHAQRIVDPSSGDDGCGKDDEDAAKWLGRMGWADREANLRAESLALVRKHWPEIEAAAKELLVLRRLSSDEVELIADVAAGDPDADQALRILRRITSADG